MILMAPCIIDFIGAYALLGPVGGGGPGHSWALKWHRAKRVPFGPRSVQGPFPPTGPSNCAAGFALLNLPKGKSLGRSKPATNSYAQALATHCVGFLLYPSSAELPNAK
jgi:hypothetical protein